MLSANNPMKRFNGSVHESAMKMLASISQRQIVIGSILFVGLLVWVWVDQLVPSATDEMPVMPEIHRVVVAATTKSPQKPKPAEPTPYAPIGTLPRFYSATAELKAEMINITRPRGPRKIMGLVFFGRRETVSILDCYLKRNLVKNGGMLDGVIFLKRTRDHHNLHLLQKMLDSEPAYSRWEVDLDIWGYGASYDMIQDDVLYIKMDDDIVYVEDTVLPSLIQTKISRPETFAVSANVVNSPMLSWIHLNLGAIRSYLPDLSDEYIEPLPGKNIEWRTSVLPSWKGPADFDAYDWSPPEDRRHRWLPTRGRKHHVLDRTPISRTEYSALGAGWQEWKVAAQEHFSFFENLERGELWRYKFNMWDFQYARMGIQFVALMGKDINSAKPIDSDDEQHFSVTMPQRTGRHAIADGRGIVAHYSYFTQYQGLMDSTDVLDRYRSFAKENICQGSLLWTPEYDLVKISNDMEEMDKPPYDDEDPE